MEIEKLTDQISNQPENWSLYLERGKLYQRSGNLSAALNDFIKVLQLNADCVEAQQYEQMIREMLDFRYKDIYNP